MHTESMSVAGPETGSAADSGKRGMSEDGNWDDTWSNVHDCNDRRPIGRFSIPFPGFDLAVCSLFYELICLSVQEALLVIISIRAPSIELRVRNVFVEGKFGEGHWGSGHVCK
jgi:hypothetical protein